MIIIHMFFIFSKTKVNLIIFFFQELQMVQILLLIVIMFVICQSFKIIPDLYEVFQCSFGNISF